MGRNTCMFRTYDDCLAIAVCSYVGLLSGLTAVACSLEQTY